MDEISTPSVKVEVLLHSSLPHCHSFSDDIFQKSTKESRTSCEESQDREVSALLTELEANVHPWKLCFNRNV